MVWTLALREGETAEGAAVGAIVLSTSGDLLVIEAGISADGVGSATVRSFAPDFSPKVPTIVSTDESTMIVG